MGDDTAAVVARIRATMNLPADTPPSKVLAVYESEAIRRAGAVGLPWDATVPQIVAAERTVAVAAAARKVAAAQMLGHPQPVVASAPGEPELHPALRPSSPSPGNSSNHIDWAAIEAAGDQ